MFLLNAMDIILQKVMFSEWLLFSRSSLAGSPRRIIVLYSSLLTLANALK